MSFVRHQWLSGAATACALSFTLATAAAADGDRSPSHAQQPSARASTLGIVSAYLGQNQVRDNLAHDVKAVVSTLGPAAGLNHPGDLYRGAAQEHGGFGG